jgi:hypothetical protein
VLDVGTIISGKLLVAHYITDPPSFSTFLPTALKIINSLRIDKAAIYSLEISHPSRQISIMILCADYTDSNFLNYSVNILDRFFSKYGNLVYLVYITNYK